MNHPMNMNKSYHVLTPAKVASAIILVITVASLASAIVQNAGASRLGGAMIFALFLVVLASCGALIILL